MAGKPGRQRIIEQFLTDGMTHMFGNPGTVEQGFLDALKDHPRMKYILTLQESVAVMIADGYARLTQKPALVQLHSSPGIGNAVGALYQAMRGHAPLVVIGGDAGIRYLNMDAQMAGDLVGMMRPVTKYATMVTDSSSLLRTLRRAVKIAATPPMGPVYVCLPMDILDQENSEDVVPSSIPSTRVFPSGELVERCAEMLLSARKPIIFVGDGVAYSGATGELTAVAELLGAEVYGVDAGDFNMDTTHPLYQGTTGHMFGTASLPITGKGDVNLVVGTYMVPEVFPELEAIFASGARVIHLDLNAYEIAKNHPVDLGIVCDPKMSLQAIARALEAGMTPRQKAAARARQDEIIKAKSELVSKAMDKDARAKTSSGVGMAEFAGQLAGMLPEDAIIFDEALTSSPELNRYIPPKTPGSFFQTRGGSLGVGIPGAMGLKLAAPDRTVIGFTGDGGSMYTIQALWTAAHHNIAAKFVICNNHSYKLLELNIMHYWKQTGIPGHAFPEPFLLKDPDIRFEGLAESMGVPAARVERRADIRPAIEQMLGSDGPFLVNLVLGDKEQEPGADRKSRL